MKLPERVTNVVKCKTRAASPAWNRTEPCSALTNPDKAQYRYLYCEQGVCPQVKRKNKNKQGTASPKRGALPGFSAVHGGFPPEREGNS